MSFYMQMKITPIEKAEQENEMHKATQITTYYMDANAKEGENGALKVERQRVRHEIGLLNKLSDTLEKNDNDETVNLSTEEQSDILLLIPRLKLVLLHRVWSKEWGDFTEFSRWANTTPGPPAPARLKIPAELYSAVPSE
jgi:hypothetical protein